MNSIIKGNVVAKAVNLVFVFVVVVSIGLVPVALVHAQDDSGFGGYSGDASCCSDTSYDTTGYTDSYTPTYDTSYDTTGYQDSYTPSYDTSYDTTGYTDSYTPEESATPVYSDQTYATPEYSTPTYSSPVVTAPQYASSYSSAPFYSQPIYAPQPIYTPAPVYHSPVPTPVVYNTPVQPNVITTTTNTCTSNSCNSTYTDNSVNNSGNTTISGSYNTNTTPVVYNTPIVANVTPVYQTPVQYPVQYVFPQQPTYPVNNISCYISASPNTIQYNQATDLTWSAPGASTAVISDGIGQVAPNGSLVARPSSSLQYVLTVYGPQGQTSSCNTYVNVSGAAPYVSLTQIPYTGFDFGPFGDAMYWLSLLSFAVAAGYLMVYYKGGAFALATEVVRGSRRSKAYNVSTATEEDEIATPVESKEVTPAIVEATMSKPAAEFKLPVMESSRITADRMSVSRASGEMPRIVISRV